MILTRTLKVICIILPATFALVGCIASSSQTSTTTSVPRLTLDLLKNAEYLFPIGDKYIRLIDGVYQEREGFVTPTLQLREQPIVFADLNADGLEDAAVILEFGAGGSGHGPILAIVLNENGMPYEIADAGLGDRTKIKDIRVDGKTIILDVVTHRFEDGLCCPTLDATWQFRFEGNKLIPLQ
jgi:hypothetical protein